jgi:hypothetical protein
MLGADTWDPPYLAGRGHDQKQAAPLAFVVGVHPVFGLLGPDVFEVLVQAVGHWSLHAPDGIYTFSRREEQDYLP